MTAAAEDAIRAALAEARRAEAAGEVPVGAIVLRDGEVIARGQNRVLRDQDPTAHAEVIALRAAADVLGNYRLNGCTVAATLEPCAMCAGALIHARVDGLIYGARDPKAGAAGSILSVLNHPSLNHTMTVVPDVLGEECGRLLREFFERRRSSPTIHNRAIGGV